MLLFLTLLITKLTLRLSRLMGRGGGSALPGLVAEHLYPGLSRRLSRQFPDGTIVVTGTNGKTTTTKMLAEIVGAGGRIVTTNRSGSNLARGILSSLIEASTLTGRIAADLAIFEVDEAAMPAVCHDLDPTVVVVLNLFRDQMDRYGELDTTAERIGAALRPLGADVYLNADDPLVMSLNRFVDHGTVHYFGVERSDTTILEHDVSADSTFVPSTGEPLTYRKNFFGHIGHYANDDGSFVRPDPEFALHQRDDELTVTVGAEKLPLDLKLPGLYNAYNALAALAAATAIGIEPAVSTKALAEVGAAFGRVERFAYRDRHVNLLLVKNPTGFNQVIQTFLLGAPKGEVLFAVNDNAADGRDLSWLWDVGIEELRGLERPVVVTGLRAWDMAVRLKYAGVRAEVEPDLADAVDLVLARSAPGEDITMLPTYTAMLELRALLAKSVDLKEIWE